ncbi:MAG TPA: methionyl-tRNA formyltransferase, partial [Enterovirga sp.]|nr:methionyl-tRNA formyltransferase [Enterovirga sp.]
MSLRVVFMGTPDFAVPTLEAIAGAGHEIAAVYTRAPAASGRGLRARPSQVQQSAERLGFPIETPAGLKGDEAVSTLRGYRPDVAVVVAYGMLLPQAALDVPVRGCLNLHASLLPRWRGAAPIQRAI